MASPFQAATTLSSRAGCGRASRAASRAARTRSHRPSSSGSTGSCSVDAPCSKVPAGGDLQQGGGPLAVVRAEHLDQLRRRPGVRQSLDAVRVGVQRRGEPALGGAQVADHPVRGLAGPPAGPAVTRSPATGGCRRAAATRCRTASSRSAAPPSPRRPSSARSRRPAGRRSRRGPSPRRCPRPSAARRRPRCARGGAAAAPAPSTAGTSGRRRSRPAARRTSAARDRTAASSRSASGGGAPSPTDHGLLGQARDDPLARGDHLVAALGPGLRHRREQLGERRHAVPRRRREVGAAVEREPVRRGEHRHRPAAVAGERGGRLHVDGVDVRPLLAVDLDRHEVRVEERGDLRRPRTTRAPSRGTSGRRRSRSRGAPARPARAPRRTPRRPTAASRPGCPGAAAGTARCWRRDGWAPAHPAWQRAARRPRQLPAAVPCQARSTLSR